MTNKNIKHVLAVSISLGLAAPASVFATNGMFLIANGTKSNGMGGVSIAMTHDTLTSAINPATMAFTGNRFDIGGDIFIPAASASLVDANGDTNTVESKPTHFTLSEGVYMMPNLGASWSDGDISYGFTMVPVGGGGSRYAFNLFNATNATGAPVSEPLGVSLMVMNINPTIAMKLDDTHTVGATLIIGMQVFKAFGLSEFTTFTANQTASAKLTNEGADVTYGAGLRLGWLGKYMNNDLTLGAEYTSQTYMKAFDRYTDLFAEQGKINTPGNIGIGAAYQFNDDLILAMDINYIMYEDVASISNGGPNVTSDPFPVDRATNALGADGGLGFGWTNQTVFKLGADYRYNEAWSVRGGWNYGKSPINENREILFNIVAPATTQHHLTLGATWQFTKDMEASFSYIHAFKYKQFGPTQIGTEGSIEMEQDSFGATFSMNF